jgi:spore coat protein U-like protein
MNMTTKLGLLCIAIGSTLAASDAMAVQITNTLNVSAALNTSCEVSANSAIDFGSFAVLASSGDKTANSGTTFQVACSADATPAIYSGGTRSMSNGTDLLPFNLSLTSGAGSNDLPTTSGAASAFTLNQDGNMHSVVLYAKTLASNYRVLSSGSYSTNVTVAIVY